MRFVVSLLVVAALAACSTAVPPGPEFEDEFEMDDSKGKDWSQSPDVQQACVDALAVEDDIDHCLALAKYARLYPADIIRACAAVQPDNGGETLVCIGDTVGAGFDVADDITWCARSLDEVHDVARCYKLMAEADYYASGLAESCGDYTFTDSDFFWCLDQALAGEMTPADLDECDDITVGSDEFIACLEDS